MAPWTEAALGDAITEARPGFASGDDTPDGVLQVRMNNVTTDGILDFSKQRRVPADDRTGRFALRSGDVLFNATNSPALVGKTALFLGWDEPVVFSNHFLRLRTDEARLLPAYLAGWMRYQYGRGVFGAMAQRWVNQAAVRTDRLLRMPVPLPPLAEQRQIVRVLAVADGLRRLRRDSLVMQSQLPLTLFVDAFGNPHAGRSPWSLCSLEEVCDAINDCPHSTPVWTDSGAVCLRTSNLTEGDWDWDEKRFVSEETFTKRSRRGILQPGDIVLSREGTVGVAAIVPNGMRACMGQRLVQVRPSGTHLTSEYLLRYLLSVLHPDRIGRVMVGSTARHLNVKELRSLRVPIPPIELQVRYSVAMDRFRRCRTAAAKHLSYLDDLLASLDQRAFTGAL